MHQVLRQIVPLIALVGAVITSSTDELATASTPPLPSIDASAPDPYGWLEERHGAHATAWVAREDAATKEHFSKDARYEELRQAALNLYTRHDRIPTPALLGDKVTNLFQDKDHPAGIWRITSSASYRSATPKWERLLDLDAVSKVERKHWVFKGATCLQPADRLCMVSLSDGGGDAVEVREFDMIGKGFVPTGFRLPIGEQNIAWLDADDLLVARDWGPGTTSASGHPLVVKEVHRGAPLSEAREVSRATEGDGVYPHVYFKPDGTVGSAIFADLSSLNGLYFEFENGVSKQLDLPLKSDLEGFASGQLIFRLDQAWRPPGHSDTFKSGSLIAFNPRTGTTQLIFEPAADQAIDEVGVTRAAVLVSLLDNVNGDVRAYAPRGQSWLERRIAPPAHAKLSLTATDPLSAQAYITSEGFLDPPTLWELSSGDAVTAIKRLPPRFDSSKDIVEQHFIRSLDGIRVPYFLVRPKSIKLDGTTPTIMWGYGGFQLSQPPHYSASFGKFWLEQGCALVFANIRGGGEFGPEWHEAAVRQNRQKAFDDFAAIARDLIDRKVTTPKKLGAWGTSNGGILVSVSITQHPELFGAAVMVNPIIDMLHYTDLGGAQWVEELGDPKVAADRAYLARYSAYTAVKPGVAYPPLMIETNTADDRVSPAHARKFTALLQSLGSPVLFYEDTFGGHAGGDPNTAASTTARDLLFMTEELVDKPVKPAS